MCMIWKTSEIFRRWNIILKDSKEAVLKAMGKEKTMSRIFIYQCRKYLWVVKSEVTTFKWTFEKAADSILFVGQNGVDTACNHVAIDTATYTFSSDDTYIRVIAKNQGQNIYLNPLIRYHGSSVTMAARYRCRADTLSSLLWKVGILAINDRFVSISWWKVSQLRFKSTKAWKHAWKRTALWEIFAFNHDFAYVSILFTGVGHVHLFD